MPVAQKHNIVVAAAIGVYVTATLGLLGFMLQWMFYTNSKIDMLASQKDSITKHWRILNAHKEHINELSAQHDVVEKLSWRDINLDVPP